jgi:tRNA1Val (adenine37-N6)-methyltransferase
MGRILWRMWLVPPFDRSEAYLGSTLDAISQKNKIWKKIMPVEHQRWREYFPRGLQQPQDGFRFSIDSLLLSCYVHSRHGEKIMDLGTGCGVVSFGVLINTVHKDIELVGVDISKELIKLAQHNACNLGFDQSFSTRQIDVKEIMTSKEFYPEEFDQIICNPPYRDIDQGRMSPVQSKNMACFSTQASLQDFVAAAAYSLKNKGRCVLVFLAERYIVLTSVMQSYRLEPKRVRFVHSSKERPASLVLLESRKNGNPGVQVEPPLFIYQKESPKREFTDHILDFCPFLRCNAS